jgi:hypothetical protein
VTRAFFDQVDDELRGLVGPSLRDFNTEKSARLIKLWYENRTVHFEAQRLSQAWSPRPGPCLEVGLHLESKDRFRNQSILEGLLERRAAWSNTLGYAEHGVCFGPQGAAWRRLSEVVEIDEMDEDVAGEVAERLAGYVVTLQPVLTAMLLPQ